MAEFGTFTLFLALAAAVWAAGSSLVAARRGDEQALRGAAVALRLATGSLTVAAGVLVTLFLTRDFSVEYVAMYSDRRLPLSYTVAAFWAGQDGSLLLWAWLLAAAAVLVVRQHRTRSRELLPVVAFVLAAVLVVFTGLVATLSNPFTRLPFTPEDGAGLNAMLQNWGQLYHPPALFLGYIGFTVPFAFSIAALVTGRLGTGWIRAVRGWMVGSWLFLALGILLGARWAYTELGWGGYWAWDPVENVSLLPWLTATAYLHSAALQERRGTLRVSNLVLAITTFVLTLFGTFLVRSGVASSVHAFAESSAGIYLLAAIVATVVASAALIAWRLPLLRSPRTDGGLSRERLVVLTNALLLAYTLAIFWGTLFPVLASTVQGRDLTVGAVFYDRLTMPFTIVLLALTGLCPIVAWRRASTRGLRRRLVLPAVAGLVAGVVVLVADGLRHPVTVTVLSLAAFAATTLLLELHRGVHAHGHTRLRDHLVALGRLFVRSPRRYGGLVVHLGVVLLVVGIALDVTYRSDERHTLTVGEAVTVADYVLTLDRVETETSPTRLAVAATLEVARAGSGASVGSVVTERFVGVNQDQPRTHVGVRSLLREDIYVILEDVDVGSQTAGLHVHLHPGVLWIWVGGGVVLLGGLLAIWPFRGRPPATVDDERGTTRSTPVVGAPAPSEPDGRAGPATPRSDELEARIAERRERMTHGEAGR
jgi:cytochrome c-type biogenesis protein CcmF